jgi:hypothetical protein
MSLTYLSIDTGLVAEVNKMDGLETERKCVWVLNDHQGSSFSDYAILIECEKMLRIAMDMLAGTETNAEVSAFSETVGVPVQKLNKLCFSLSTLLW